MQRITRMVIAALVAGAMTLPAAAATFKNSSNFSTTGIVVRIGTGPIPGAASAIKQGEQKVIDTGASAVEIHAGSIGPSARWRPALVTTFPSLAPTDVVTCSHGADGKLACTRQ
jgi:uncharacterized protein YraI